MMVFDKRKKRKQEEEKSKKKKKKKKKKRKKNQKEKTNKRGGIRSNTIWLYGKIEIDTKEKKNYFYERLSQNTLISAFENYTISISV